MFFALSARVPAACMLISASTLTPCIVLIAFSAFPAGVSVLSAAVVVLMGLQFIVFGCIWFGRKVVQGRRVGRRVMRRLWNLRPER